MHEHDQGKGTGGGVVAAARFGDLAIEDGLVVGGVQERGRKRATEGRGGG